MAFSNLFKKQTLLRCTQCLHELKLSRKRVCALEEHNDSYAVCAINIHCHFCRDGFLVPVDYTDNKGNHFLFQQLKEKIDDLPPNHDFLHEEGIFDDDFGFD